MTTNASSNQLHLFVSNKNPEYALLIHQQRYIHQKSDNTGTSKRLRLRLISWNMSTDVFTVLKHDESDSPWFIDNITTLRLQHCNFYNDTLVCSTAHYGCGDYDLEHHAYVIQINFDTSSYSILYSAYQPTSYDKPPSFFLTSNDTYGLVFDTIRFVYKNIPLLPSTLKCSSCSPERFTRANQSHTMIDDNGRTVKLKSGLVLIDETQYDLTTI